MSIFTKFMKPFYNNNKNPNYIIENEEYNNTATECA